MWPIVEKCAYKLDGVKLYVIARARQPCHHSVALCRGGLIKETLLMPGLWSFAKEEAVSQLAFNFRPYATGALPAVALVLNPREGASV